MQPPKQEFIPHTQAAQDDATPDADEPQEVIVADWEGTLNALADQPGTRIRLPRDPTLRKKQVVSAFQDAFELIGGVPRLALWADQNQTEFYRLYAKLLPRQQDTTLQHDGDFTIRHVLPRGPLDE